MEDVDKGDGEGDGEGDETANGTGDQEVDGDDGAAAADNDVYFESPVRRVSFAVSQTQPLLNGISSEQQSSPHGVVLQGPSTPRVSPSMSTAQPALLTQTPQRPKVRLEALTALSYDIVPTIAAPHSTSVNAVAATPDMRWVFSGGADGYVRKFGWVDTANGKLPLTVAQRHPFVDSVTKAAILLSYWENEEPPGMKIYCGATNCLTDQILDVVSSMSDDSNSLSPVYSLAVHHQALWILSGLESGGINLQSVRHDEGKRITCLKGHKSTVSVLTMTEDERSLLSGSWDKTIKDWDLNTGQIRRTFAGSGGQIASIEFRPTSNIPVPQDASTEDVASTTFSSGDLNKPITNGVLTNGVSDNNASNTEDAEQAQGSPDDSLFGDRDSLFGDGNDGILGTSNSARFDEDDDDEFSRAIANGIQQQQDDDAQAEFDAVDLGGPVQPPEENPKKDEETTQPSANTQQSTDAEMQDAAKPHANGIISSPGEDTTQKTEEEKADQAEEQGQPTSETTFIDASIDGTLRIWDRRQPNPVARISPRKGVPPWCMNACWSPDGNTIYAGRRNNTVEEYSLHKGALREPSRVFKLPPDSGAVSAVKPMPNGKQIVWYVMRCIPFTLLQYAPCRFQLSTRYL